MHASDEERHPKRVAESKRGARPGSRMGAGLVARLRRDGRTVSPRAVKRYKYTDGQTLQGLAVGARTRGHMRHAPQSDPIPCRHVTSTRLGR